MAGRAKPQGWHREDIKAELRKRFGPLRTLSLAWGSNRAGISNTLGRSDYSPVIEERIADALGVTPHTLWPDRWSPTGLQRPRPVIEQNPSRPAPAPHRQKRGRA